MKQKVLLVGMAGTDKDFLLSVRVLEVYLNQYQEVSEKFDVKSKSFFASTDVDEMVVAIREVNPDILGLSCYLWSIKKFNKLIESFIDKKIVLGGPEIQRTEFKNNIQYIAGEGEYPLFTYLMGYPPNEQPLHESPVVLPDENVLSNPNIRVNFETQRGCNYKCSYCDYHKDYKGVRYRKPMTVIEEMCYCWQHGKTTGRIVDPNFFSNEEHAYIILKGLMDRGVKLRLVFEAIPKFLTEKLLCIITEYIKSGGELVIVQGIQSLNKKTLMAVNRPSGKESEAIDALTKAGATLKIDSILGLPLETKETYEQLIDYICEKMAKSPHNYPGINVLQPIEGTKLYKDMNKFGLIAYNGFIYETPTITRSEMIEFIRMNAVIFRIFGPIHDDIRKQYVEKNYTSHVPNLRRIVNHLVKNMSEDSNFITLKDPEFYYKETVRDVPADLILEAL